MRTEKRIEILFATFIVVLSMVFPLQTMAAVLISQPDFSTPVNDSTTGSLQGPYTATGDGLLEGVGIYVAEKSGSPYPLEHLNVGLYGDFGSGATTCFSTTAGTFDGKTVVSTMQFYAINGSGDLGGCYHKHIISGNSYYFFITGYNAAESHNAYTSYLSSAGSLATVFQDAEDTSVVPPITDTSTRIITTTPANGDTVSSSTPTTIGATGYINPSDYDSDEFIRLSFEDRINYYSIIRNVPRVIDIPISSSGSFSVSTSTDPFTEGTVNAKYSIENPTLVSNTLGWVFSGQSPLWGNLFNNGNPIFGPEVVVSTTTQFVSGARTFLDVATASSTTALNNFLSGIDLSTVLYDCYPTHLSLGSCLVDVIVPPTCSINSHDPSCPPGHTDGLVQIAQTGFLSYAPFGYLTRFLVIANATTTATSSLPHVGFTVPSYLPGAGAVFDFNVFGNLMGTTSILGTATSTASGKTIKEIVEPWWNAFWLLVLILAVIVRLLGLRHKEK